MTSRGATTNATWIADPMQMLMTRPIRPAGQISQSNFRRGQSSYR